jgi:hypothetical protein
MKNIASFSYTAKMGRDKKLMAAKVVPIISWDEKNARIVVGVVESSDREASI